MAAERGVKDQVDLWGPVLEKLMTMMGAGRDAFNRHSRESLDQLRHLRTALAQEIAAAAKELNALQGGQSAVDRAYFLKLHSLLGQLEDMGQTVVGLAEPLQKKIRGAVLFSDKAVSQANQLFDRQAGLLRSLLDIIKTDNEFLKRYVTEECHHLIQACNDMATEHEARLIEGLCLPQAAPIFLALLDHMRALARHELEMVQLMTVQA